ncbi:uncharacterized protein LOC126369895 [Pectinophora gossypiella]|uniref:uncharacterized protein LOC126369895 n=1 Tax=Pectinophora gossypiella TaxID=13191 RepID=UPI00214EDB5C|nr:uncharacterized protein LOC126369895 [Pectinophora gossypiella]
MNVLGYMVTLANLQSFQRPGQNTDVSLQMGPLQSLADEILSLPQYPPEEFKKTGYYRVGNVGKYLSTNLQDFLINKTGNPNDEGLILTLYFSDIVGPQIANDKVQYSASDKVPNGLQNIANAYAGPVQNWPPAY